MFLVKDILLQLFFIIVPILFLEIGLIRKNEQAYHFTNRLLFAASSALSILLCMSFPITIDGGLQYDLRSIPIVISFLYGGYGLGALSFVVMLLYRGCLGGEGIWVVLYGSLYLILPIYFVGWWNRYARGKKLLLSLIIGLSKQLSTAIVILLMGILNGRSLSSILLRMEIFIAVGFIYVAGLVIAVLLTEYLRETALMRAQLQRSEKLALISELAASVAHEVRNPLTVVRGFVQLLREEVDQERKEYLRLVLSELDRAEFIISDYLSLARPQEEMIETIDVAEMINEVTVVMYSYALMNGVQVKSQLEEGLFIKGDKIQYKQVLMNLIKNGIEAMPDGGTIELAAKHRDQQVMITIKDTGVGMSEEQLVRMGLPFYTTKEKGTGLGLLVSFRIIEAMGGSIQFASEQGKGTDVIILLPLIAKP